MGVGADEEVQTQTVRLRPIHAERNGSYPANGRRTEDEIPEHWDVSITLLCRTERGVRKPRAGTRVVAGSTDRTPSDND